MAQERESKRMVQHTACVRNLNAWKNIAIATTKAESVGYIVNAFNVKIKNQRKR